MDPALICRDPHCTFPQWHVLVWTKLALFSRTVWKIHSQGHLHVNLSYQGHSSNKPLSAACSWCDQSDFSKTFSNVHNFLTNCGWQISHILCFMLCMSHKRLWLGWRVSHPQLISEGCTSYGGYKTYRTSNVPTNRHQPPNKARTSLCNFLFSQCFSPQWVLV